MIYLPPAGFFDHLYPERVRAHAVYSLDLWPEDDSHVGVVPIDDRCRRLDMRLPFRVPVLSVDKIVSVPLAALFALEPLSQPSGDRCIDFRSGRARISLETQLVQVPLVKRRQRIFG